MIRRATRALGGLLVFVGLGLGVHAALEHDRARDRWVQESARHDRGEPAYDPHLSDGLYYATIDHQLRAQLVGWIAAPGWVLLAMSLGGARREPRVQDSRVGRPLHVAVLVDGALGFGLLGLALYVEARAGGATAAWGAVGAAQLLGIALAAAWGGASTGLSLGGWLTRTAVVDASARAPGPARGLASVLLLPFGLIWAPIALAMAPSTPPPHHAWVGLRGVATTGPNI